MNDTTAPDYLLYAISAFEQLALIAAHSGWLRAVSRPLLFTLITLDLIWYGGISVLLSASHPVGYARFLIRRVLAYFFAFAVWEFYPVIVPAFVSSMGQMATALMGPVTDVGQLTNPAEILAVGIDVTGDYVAAASSSVLGGMMGWLYYPMAIVIFASFGLVAALVALVRIELLLVLISGYPLLAFGGHSVTRALAAGYLQWAMGVAIRIFFLALLGTSLMRVGYFFISDFQTNHWFPSATAMLAPLPGFVVLAILACQVNRVAHTVAGRWSWHPGPSAPGARELEGG